MFPFLFLNTVFKGGMFGCDGGEPFPHLCDPLASVYQVRACQAVLVVR